MEEADEISLEWLRLDREQQTDRRAIRLAQAQILLEFAARLEEEGGTGGRKLWSAPPTPEKRAQEEALEGAFRAYSHAYQALADLGESHREACESAYARSQVMKLRREERISHPTRFHERDPQRNIDPLGVGGEVLAGFVAIKFLGPFLEEFAKKLGQKLGESTARAVGRIRLRRRHPEAEELTAALPGHVTTLVLPPVLTDAVRLAVIELDTTDPEVVGATLYWNAATQAWQRTEPLRDRYRLRAWDIRYTWTITDPELLSHPQFSYDRVPASRQEAQAVALQEWSATHIGVEVTEIHIRHRSDAPDGEWEQLDPQAAS